eukprot:CAMPEP_0172913128 /NCGR_PEP_ID=MMETSP1075-20121228/189791_1 /TAXON_ID=2916 /ORGANISM="Ceratium fusus, Strain PA161109" /LENGTH=145 /DNA_ID=CAMNT_0013771765 /DNA_START=452 /DNA_END=889 /DNA_ORIENTATION=-
MTSNGPKNRQQAATLLRNAASIAAAKGKVPPALHRDCSCPCYQHHAAGLAPSSLCQAVCCSPSPCFQQSPCHDADALLLRCCKTPDVQQACPFFLFDGFQERVLLVEATAEVAPSAQSTPQQPSPMLNTSAAVQPLAQTFGMPNV